MSNEDWENDFFDVAEQELEDAAQEEQVKPPKQYNVFILNDDFSTRPFVILCLQRLFGKTSDEGHRITQIIHTKGKGLAGTYTKDIAETKAQELNDYAQSKGYPLTAEAEQAPE